MRTPHVEAELVAARTALTPGQPLTVALRLVMQRGWHTYWQNPGDSGLPTTIEWKLPPGVSAGGIQRPVPQVLPVGPLVNFGYEGEVLLLVDVAAAPDLLSGKSTTLSARADWLVCKEICIPEGVDLSLALPVASSAEADPRWAEPIAQARAALPKPLAGWRVTATGQGDKVELALAANDGAVDPGKLHFFPFAEGKIEAVGAQVALRDGARTTLALPVARQRVGEFNRVAGVLTASEGFGAQRAATIDVPLVGRVVAPAAAAPAVAAQPAPIIAGTGETALPLFVALTFAFVGGILLNLMPCVFPVLSLKVLGFAAHRNSRAAMRKHGLAFAAGVVVSFWALAALLVALRAAGQQLGWGFQLQSPVVVTALAILFFALALNLSGLFEVRQLMPSALAGWNARNPYVNDALSGVLAVVIASPCSAPFMGAALGYALTESAPVTWATFTMLGLGMALPYVLLAFFPAWRAKLPKPGPWMLRLRQLLAFPLYATVVWLAWVLGAQLDNDAVARLGAVLLLIARRFGEEPVQRQERDDRRRDARRDTERAAEEDGHEEEQGGDGEVDVEQPRHAGDRHDQEDRDEHPHDRVPEPSHQRQPSRVFCAPVRIVLGSDERTPLTDSVVEDLKARGHDVVLVGPPAGDAMQWAEVGRRVGEQVAGGEAGAGVLFCWTGTGAVDRRQQGCRRAGRALHRRRDRSRRPPLERRERPRDEPAAGHAHGCARNARRLVRDRIRPW